MKTFLYDGTFLGLLSCVFFSYKQGTFPRDIYRKDNFQLDLISDFIEIENVNENAKRVEDKLKKILKKENFYNLNLAFNSTKNNKEIIIFNYIKEIVDNSLDISDNFANEKVYLYHEIVNQVRLEAHRFKGFIRFKKLNNGIYYAVFEPDNIINNLILPHFIKRYKTMPFILHDIKNNVISWYNTKTYQTIFKKISKINFVDEFDKLFKTYYDSVNIKERKNITLMHNYMPKRYHKNLPEKTILTN